VTGFAVYDPATGLIKRSGICTAGDLAIQAQSGEAVIETSNQAPGSAFKVDITQSPPVVIAYTPPAPTPTPTQSYAAALSAGVAIASTSAPALNATYGCAAQDEINITAMQTAILTNASLFPGYWRNLAGAKVTMTAAQFTAIATAIMDYIVALDDWLAASVGTSAPLPAAAATIA
jgi:hypothetical protein